MRLEATPEVIYAGDLVTTRLNVRYLAPPGTDISTVDRHGGHRVYRQGPYEYGLWICAVEVPANEAKT